MQEKGFTIIELIISIFILSLSVVGVFSAFSIMSIFSADSADRLTAAYLAQEGMEIVRNIRDTNWLNMDVACAGYPNGQLSDGKLCSAMWVDGLEVCANGCKASYKSQGSSGLYSVSAYTDADYLYLDTNGFYGYENKITKTKFRRKIIIEPIEIFPGQGSNDVIKVTTKVLWDAKSSLLTSSTPTGIDECNPANCVKAEETLYNWYPTGSNDIYYPLP